MLSRRRASLEQRLVRAPETSRPRVTLPQYTPTQTPATPGATPRPSVKRL
jgi:hypothetical protein